MARTAQQRQADYSESMNALTGYVRIDPTESDTLYIAREGSFFRVYVIHPNWEGKPELFNITWHVGNVIGASVRDRSGRWYIHMTGGQYDKADDIRRRLGKALFDDTDALRHRDI